MSKEDRTKVATTIIAFSFIVSALASVGLAVVYSLGGQVQAEGALLGVALGSIAVGLVVWAKNLMPGGHFVEEREPHPSPTIERVGAVEEFEEGAEGIERRSFLGKLVALALGGLGIVALFPIRSLGERPGADLLGTKWEAGLRLVTRDNVPIRADEFVTGSILTIWPEGRTDADDSPAILIQVDPREVAPLPGREDWTPEGFIAYSKICTHAGCAVGLYEKSSQQLFCPCHQSVFDAIEGAKPLGGPATRPLPQLPLGIDEDGFLFARGDFSEPVGPGFWRMG